MICTLTEVTLELQSVVELNYSITDNRNLRQKSRPHWASLSRGENL